MHETPTSVWWEGAVRGVFIKLLSVSSWS